MTLTPTPTTNTRLKHRRAEFSTITEALDYAAQGETGQNYYSARGELQFVLPYRDLRDQARALAAKLTANGFQQGDRIVLIADTEPDFVILFFACQYASLLPVPVAVPTSFGGKDAYLSQLRQQMINCDARAVWAPESLRQFVVEAVKDQSMTFVMAGKDPFALEGSGDLRPWGKNEPSYLQFSSGSTRFPKGIDIGQAPLMANCHGIINSGLDIMAVDRAASWLPFYHDMGLVGFMLAALAGQTSVDYMATRDFARRPLTWLQLMANNRCSLAYSPSFGYELCVRRMRDGTEFQGDLSCWRAAGIGGDMVQPHVLDRFVECFGPQGFRREAFVPSYGMAETVLAISFTPLNRGHKVDFIDRNMLREKHIAHPTSDQVNARGFVACGAPLPHHQVEIRDEAGKIAGDRQIGRIFVRGPSVMNGYFRQPEETSAVLSPDGWLDTGDLGYWWDKEIVITGRAKDLIIINGRNIWPQDLEWSAEELSELRRGDVAAFSIEDQGSEQVVVLVQCRLSEPASREELIRNVAAQLQKFSAVDAKVVLIPPHTLPQTSSGKLSRAKAKLNYLNGLYG